MKKYLPFLLIAGVLIVSACGTKQEVVKEPVVNNPEPQTINLGNYLIDSEKSQINWHAAKIVGNSHDGTVKIKNGSVTLGTELSEGTIIIDMTTIADNENNASLIKHLKSDDFFAVDTFPESKIVIKSITPKTGELNKYEISGELTIKEKTNPVNFEVSALSVNDVITLDGSLTIDRSLWDVRFGSDKFFDNLGDKAISNNIDYKISIVANLIK